LADEGEEEEDEFEGGVDKVVLCHKDKNSIMVGAPGLDAHLGHGDVEGYCGEDTGPGKPEDSDGAAAVVVMNCSAGDDDLVRVNAFSSSLRFSEAPLNEPVIGANCAYILAALMDEGLWLRSVTGATDYLLVGEVDDD